MTAEIAAVEPVKTMTITGPDRPGKGSIMEIAVGTIEPVKSTDWWPPVP